MSYYFVGQSINGSAVQNPTTFSSLVTLNGGAQAGATQALGWSGRTQLTAPVDGQLQVANNAGTASAIYDQSGNAIPSVIDTSRVYFVDDFISCNATNNSVHNFMQSGTNNVANINCVMSSDNENTNAADPTALNHPGVAFGCTQAVGYAYANLYNSTHLINYVASSGVTQVVSQHFRTPRALSNGTNTYTMYVGIGVLSTTGPVRGWYLKYTHGTNSGNWQVCQFQNGGSEVVQFNTSVAAVASKWSNLVITISGGANNSSAVTFVLDGVNLGSFAVDSTLIAPTSQAPMNPGIIGLTRSVSDGSTYLTAFMDRISYDASGLAR